MNKQGAKVHLASLSAEGETSIGWFRSDDSRFGVVLLVLGEHVYAGTNTGVFRVRWTQPCDGDAPLVAHRVWMGAARTLFARPTIAVCAWRSRRSAV